MTEAPEEPKSSSRKPILIIAGVIVALIVIGVIGIEMSSTTGSTDDSDSVTVVVDDAETVVSMRDFKYRPASLSIARGGKVTWLNDDNVDHTATDRNGQWDSRVVHSEQSQTVEFNTPGTYGYYCTIHPGMSGTLIVRTDEVPTPAATATRRVDATPTPTHN